MTSNFPHPQRHTPFARFEDLVAPTDSLRSNDRSIKSWLERAQHHDRSAKGNREMGRLDYALADYLMASTIVLAVIPDCREYPTFQASQTPSYQAYLALRSALDGEPVRQEYEKIQRIIKADNQKSGVPSVADQPDTLPPTTRRTNGAASHHQSQNGVMRVPVGGRSRPAPDPAPRQPGSDVNGTGLSREALELEARLGRLRPAPRPKSVPTNGLPSSLVAGLALGGTRPMGPRDMPAGPSQLHIEVRNGLPQMPPPTYSPSASYASPGRLSPPRSSTRASVPDAPKPKFPPSTDVLLRPKALADYIGMSSTVSILLLDVRPREMFDQGHIQVPLRSAVVCIEPIVLRSGMSADELQNALIVGPNAKEQDWFRDRAQYDLVVYHDQSTTDTSYLKSQMGSHALQTLHLALTDFDCCVTLRRSPLLLAGGLDAWVDLYGPASLAITAAEEAKEPLPGTKPKLFRQSREVTRAPTPHLLERRAGQPHAPPPYPTSTHGSAQRLLAMPAEPTRTAVEEEKKRVGSLQEAPLSMSVPAGTEDGKQGTSTVATIVPYARTVEEFFRQYQASHTQENMGATHFPSSKHTIIDHPFHVFTDVRNPEFNPPTSPARPPPALPRKSYSGVSEPLAGVALPTVPPRPPKISMASRSVSGTANFAIGTTGLKNLGNTCYMNSVLQCMSGTVPLSRYFLDGSYKSHINRDNPLGSGGVLAEAFAGVIRNLWSGEYGFIAPQTMKEVSGRLNETFGSESQQDAQEFLAFLLDGLHEDLNQNAMRTKLNPLTERDERQRERLPQQIAAAREWQRYTHQNSSVAVEWLQGQLSSRLTCLTCRKTSTTYSPFMYLSLPIPVVSGTFTLQDCLNEFTKEEVLDGDDAWHCPDCKKPRRATKKLTITRLPIILIIHLKRFTNNGPWRDKLNTPISFPLVRLELTKYVPPPLPPSAAGPVALGSPNTTPPFVYDLYGTVNHYGTLHGGHYTSFVKNPYEGEWSCFDDSKAAKMDASQVVSRSAYVLFWVRTGVM